MKTSHKRQSTANKKLLSLVAGIWGMILVLGVGLGAFLFSKGMSSVPPATAPMTFTPAPTSSPTPALASQASSRPTTTPTLTSTVSPTPTQQPPTKTAISATPSPEVAQVIVIGHSVMGRPIEVYQFGTGPKERLIIAGVHGGYEWNTIALADELIDYLTVHPEVVPPEVSLYILRSLNPDGEARSHGYTGRANEHEVDVNRNFPSDWQPDWARDGCWDHLPITAGSHAGSEPETRAVMSFIQSHTIDTLISYHSAALGIFAGGKPPSPKSLALAEALAAISGYSFPPIDTGCEYTGQLADWASDRGIAAVDIELSNHEDTDFEQNLRILAVFLGW